MRVRVELYGRLREAGLGEALELAVPDRPSARDVLDAAAARFARRAPLLKSCVLAGESQVLSPEAPLPAGERLALLPPVCGG